MTNTLEQEKQLENLLLSEKFKKFNEDSSLERIRNFTKERTLKKEKEFNIFKVLKLDNYEIRHSNFLAWLLNPAESHNLGYEFLKKFFEPFALIDWNEEKFIDVETEVLTNKNRRIDILIKGKKFLCVIENKYGSCEHDEQCKHYKEFINSCDNYKIIPNKYFVFLDIDLPDEKALKGALKDYYPITYRQIHSILKDIANNNSTDGIEIQIIKQYISILKEKYSMLEENIKQECRKIYDEHKEVYETLKEFEKEFQTDLYNIMKSVVNEDENLINDDRNGFGYDDSTGSGIRFITRNLQKDCLLWDEKLTKHKLFFILEYKNSLKLSICKDWKTISFTNENGEKYNYLEIDFRHKTDEEIKAAIKKAIMALVPVAEKEIQ